MNDTTEQTLTMLQDIKDMLMGLAIMFAGLLVTVFLGGLLGVFAFWIAVILAVAGAGVVWQGWHSHRVPKKAD